MGEKDKKNLPKLRPSGIHLIEDITNSRLKKEMNAFMDLLYIFDRDMAILKPEVDSIYKEYIENLKKLSNSFI